MQMVSLYKDVKLAVKETFEQSVAEMKKGEVRRSLFTFSEAMTYLGLARLLFLSDKEYSSLNSLKEQTVQSLSEAIGSLPKRR